MSAVRSAPWLCACRLSRPHSSFCWLVSVPTFSFVIDHYESVGRVCVNFLPYTFSAVQLFLLFPNNIFTAFYSTTNYSSKTDVKNEWSHTSTPHIPPWRRQEKTLYLPFHGILIFLQNFYNFFTFFFKLANKKYLIPTEIYLYWGIFFKYVVFIIFKWHIT